MIPFSCLYTKYEAVATRTDSYLAYRHKRYKCIDAIRTVSWPAAATSETLVIAAVAARGQEIFPAVRLWKTTTCQFYTLVSLRIKQRYNVLIGEL